MDLHSTLPVTLDDLPDEVLSLVLARLSVEDLLKAQDVCRRWRELCCGAGVWREAKLVYELQTTPGSDFCRVVSVAPALRSVVFKNSQMPDDVVQAVLCGCRSVRSLTFRCTLDITTDSLVAILRHFADDVQELAIQVEPARVEVLQAIADMKKLRRLRLGGSVRLGPGERNPLAQTHGVLRSVDVSDLQGLSTSVVSQFVMDILAANRLQLRAVVLPKRIPFDNRVFSDIVPRCVKLERLSVDFEDIECIANLRSLKMLELRCLYCSQFCEAASFIRTCPQFAKLRELSLILSASVDGAVEVVRACSELRTLELRGDSLCRSVTLLVGAAASTVQNLKVRCFDLRMRHLLTIPKVLPNLSFLDVRGCFLGRGIPPAITRMLSKDLPGLTVLADKFVVYERHRNPRFDVLCEDDSTDISDDGS